MADITDAGDHTHVTRSHPPWELTRECWSTRCLTYHGLKGGGYEGKGQGWRDTLRGWCRPSIALRAHTWWCILSTHTATLVNINGIEAQSGIGEATKLLSDLRTNPTQQLMILPQAYSVPKSKSGLLLWAGSAVVCYERGLLWCVVCGVYCCVL